MSFVETVPRLLRSAAKACPRRVFLRVLDSRSLQKPAVPWTYGEFETQIRKAIGGLVEAGVGKGSRIVILAENSPEWQVFALAGQTLRAEVVGLFATLGETEVATILPGLQPEAILVSSSEQLAKVSPVLGKLNNLKLLVVLDAAVASAPAVECRSYQRLLSGGTISEERFSQLVDAVNPDDLFIMIFTSGTSGRFKGVRLSHRAFIASLSGGAATVNLKDDGVGLLALPFGHVAGQCLFFVAVMTRGSVIFCPNRKGLSHAFSLGPTYTLLVPFIWERIYHETLKNIRGYPQPMRRLMDRMLSAVVRVGKGRGRRARDRALARLAAGILGRKIKRKLGGKLGILISAGSPIDRDIAAFFRGLGFEFLNYYGMSETGGTIALDSVLDRKKKIGSSGKPWKTVEVKIAEDGEILVRGETLFAGYLDKQDTVDSFTQDGFFRTGDIGKLDNDGYLFVTGRKKHLIVLCTGEKVSAEAVEQKLHSILPVEAAILLGDREAFVAAGLFVGKAELQRLEQAIGCQHVESFYLDRIREGLKGIVSFAIPEKVFVIPGSPTDYPEIVTPTLKIKRDRFVARFRPQIDEVFGRR